MKNILIIAETISKYVMENKDEFEKWKKKQQKNR